MKVEEGAKLTLRVTNLNGIIYEPHAVALAIESSLRDEFTLRLFWVPQKFLSIGHVYVHLC